MTWSEKAGLIDRADTQVLLGERVLVLKLSGAWAQIVVPDQSTPLDARGYPGWIPSQQLTAAAAPTTVSVASVTSPTAWLRGISGEAVFEVSFGTRLAVLEPAGTSLWVALPGGGRVTIRQADVTVSAGGTLPATAASVVADANRFVGLQYLWAGASGFGYDCSGLVYTVYELHGVRLPRDADAQARAGRWVDRGSLRSGDLVFFGSSADTVHHVAIYVGTGNILESPRSGYPVRVIPIATYGDYFTGRRVLP